MSADQAALDRINRACQACECDRTYGIAFACPATLLPKVKLIVRGELMDIPRLMPAAFECPRHVIMGW